MVYSIKGIVEKYVKEFIKFIEINNLSDVGGEDLSELFSYGVRVIYDIPYFKHNFYVDRYGDNCVKFLKKVKGVPKKSKRLSIEDKVNIVTMCNSYFLAVEILGENKGLKGCVNDGDKESL